MKQLLKEAKEGLKKNDYIGAAKACKVSIYFVKFDVFVSLQVNLPFNLGEL